ncbi:hypothetical protein FJY68_05670 [candidate division WOR-3 bacterium]|uniref:Uncharacterized protein n=1 Tax=candidate division WOR-3 bacterium TaxID=2052148 RepID=A0A937XGR5_UNCW3|nr:hypothetical protein [candidate division WOR-3 bacterium]
MRNEDAREDSMKAGEKKSGRKGKGATRRVRREGPTKADIKSYLDLVALESQSRGVIRVLPGVKIRLQFSDKERRLILDDWTISMGLNEKQTKALDKAKRPELSMTLVDWEDFQGYVASASNHARDGSKLQRRADALSDRIQELLDRHTDE